MVVYLFIYFGHCKETYSADYTYLCKHAHKCAVLLLLASSGIPTQLWGQRSCLFRSLGLKTGLIRKLKTWQTVMGDLPACRPSCRYGPRAARQALSPSPGNTAVDSAGHISSNSSFCRSHNAEIALETQATGQSGLKRSSLESIA